MPDIATAIAETRSKLKLFASAVGNDARRIYRLIAFLAAFIYMAIRLMKRAIAYFPTISRRMVPIEISRTRKADDTQ